MEISWQENYRQNKYPVACMIGELTDKVVFDNVTKRLRIEKLFYCIDCVGKDFETFYQEALASCQEMARKANFVFDNKTFKLTEYYLFQEFGTYYINQLSIREFKNLLLNHSNYLFPTPKELGKK